MRHDDRCHRGPLRCGHARRPATHSHGYQQPRSLDPHTALPVRQSPVRLRTSPTSLNFTSRLISTERPLLPQVGRSDGAVPCTGLGRFGFIRDHEAASVPHLGTAKEWRNCCARRPRHARLPCRCHACGKSRLPSGMQVIKVSARGRRQPADQADDDTEEAPAAAPGKRSPERLRVAE
jgi:hypothetical protein